MNIQEFIAEKDNLTVERRRNFANRLMNELTKRINQDYAANKTSEVFEHDILPIADDLEADDYFGTEGFNA